MSLHHTENSRYFSNMLFMHLKGKKNKKETKKILPTS